MSQSRAVIRGTLGKREREREGQLMHVQRAAPEKGDKREGASARRDVRGLCRLTLTKTQ
jgi:hypothetical protein